VLRLAAKQESLMTHQVMRLTRTEWIALAVSLPAALVSAGFGFAFGYRVGGALVGVMAALCAAAMGAILTSAAVEGLGARLRR
jgi:hypothetical protein